MIVKVVVKETTTKMLDIGDIPMKVVRDMLTKNKGSFDGNYGLGDASGVPVEFDVDSVEIEPE